MPAQTPTPRPSLVVNLEERYSNQHAGGAFDAGNIPVQGHASLTLNGTPSLASSTWTPAGFKLQQPSMATEYNDKALNIAASNGHTNRKYKP